MSASILALTRYNRMGASSRIRFLQYLPSLKSQGLDVEVQALLPDTYLTRLYSGGGRSALSVVRAIAARLSCLLARSDYDLVWLQRELMPFIPFAVEQKLLRSMPLVIDFDDAHHLYYRSQPSAIVRRLFSNKIDSLMRLADVVVVGNDTLANYAAQIGADNIAIVPSAVDVSKFGTSSHKQIQSTKLILGWIGTPVTAAQSLPLIQKPLRQFLATSGARCILMGADANTDYGFAAEHMDWSEPAEAAFMAKIDIGLCPLEDTEWNRGKSGYKVIQYMAAGKPSLVSPVGIASQIVDHQQTGLHCVTEQEWASALNNLSVNLDLRAAMGAQARAEALSRYDVSVAANRLAEIFTSVIRA